MSTSGFFWYQTHFTILFSLSSSPLYYQLFRTAGPLILVSKAFHWLRTIEKATPETKSDTFETPRVFLGTIHPAPHLCVIANRDS
jgi:hypothetical protein